MGSRGHSGARASIPLITKWRSAGVGAAVMLAAGLTSHAVQAQNLVQNGTFQVTGTTSSFEFGTFTQSFLSSQSANTSYVPPGTVADWTTTNGFNFVFIASSASAGAESIYEGTTGNTPFQVWNAATSGVPSSNKFNLKSPTGGNYIAMDGAYDQAAVTQPISGLKIGETYTLSFVWAAAQETPFTTATTEQLQVTLGNQTDDTPVVTNPAEGFTGWMTATFNYVATATTETLSFLSVGTPSNVPPVALLANVTLVPEPASSAVLISGIVGLIGLRQAAQRKRQAKAADNELD